MTPETARKVLPCNWCVEQRLAPQITETEAQLAVDGLEVICNGQRQTVQTGMKSVPRLDGLGHNLFVTNTTKCPNDITQVWVSMLG